MYQRNTLSTGNEIVDSMGTIEITGNIICNNWYNWVLRENGKPYHLAISILAEIVYWYKPTEIRDEITGRTIGFKKSFMMTFYKRVMSSSAINSAKKNRP